MSSVASVLGTQSCTITASSHQPCDYTADGIIKGECSSNIASAVVKIPDDSCRVGDNITIPLILQSSNNLIQSGVHDFKAKISYNSSLLFPINGLLPGTQTGGIETIEISGPVTDSVGTLYNMHFTAALGNAECTEMSIDTMIWQDAMVNVSMVNGQFCLTNVCHEGGSRLINTNQNIKLMEAKPNPAGDKVIFNFETIEDGQTELFLSDLLGNKLATIFETGSYGKYTIEFDLSSLNSGIYFYTLKTPTARMSKALIVNN